MPLSPGDKLGPYEILAPLGAGGMGEVYRARDPRLNREVAIKVSKQRFSDRFEREARAAAALNHPNICRLYDVGPDYLVMELVEGETLAARLRRGALKPDQAVALAIQIAGALAEAHSKFVVHRDLKPANIMLGKAGAKVLDFGLAKMEQPVTDSQPTVTMTAEGTVLGTVQYMSPEQAQGKEMDARSDIFSFGLLLYEMITGRRAFDGSNPTAIVAAILEREAPSLEPAGLNRVVSACLAKDPADRFQTACDLKRALEWSGSGNGVEGAPAPGGARRLRETWSLGAALAAIAAVALWAPWRMEQPASRPLARLDVDVGADIRLAIPRAFGSTVAISPDATRLVFAAGSPVKLFLRRLEERQVTGLLGTEGASVPFFSPDGRWVGFHSGGRLSKIPVQGGAVVRLADFANFAGADWGEDGSIVVSAVTDGLLRIPANGGPPKTVAMLGNGEFTFSSPQILPGGKAILFAATTIAEAEEDKSTVEVLTLRDGHRKPLVRGAQSPRYLPALGGANYLVYVNKGRLFAIPFDLEKLETRGTAVPVLDDVAYGSGLGIGQLGFSPAPSGHGAAVYRAGGSEFEVTTLERVGPSGTREPLGNPPGRYDNPGLSPDGKRIALQESPDVWVYDSQRGTMTRLTFGGVVYDHPIWSPDGRFVVFGSHGKGMFEAPENGASQPRELTERSESKTNQFPCSFTPDGKRLAYYERGAGNRIWTLPLEERGGQLTAGKPEPFLKDGFNERSPSFSPDGRWIAYASDESGKYEVYVRPFPALTSGPGGKLLISTGGGLTPHFSRNGRDLFYESGNQIMAVSYTVKGGAFAAGIPRVWIARLDGALAGNSAWDVAPDGKSIVVLRPVASAETPSQEHEVVFLLNFLDELRRRVPAGK